jgi:hypothetical protein
LETEVSGSVEPKAVINKKTKPQRQGGREATLARGFFYFQRVLSTTIAVNGDGKDEKNGWIILDDDTLIPSLSARNTRSVDQALGEIIFLLKRLSPA